MTVRCPSGHESQTSDYCDQCGARIGGVGTTADPSPGAGSPSPGATQILPVVEELETSPSTRREPCPVCGAPRSGDDRYCEGAATTSSRRPRPPPAGKRS